MQWDIFHTLLFEFLSLASYLAIIILYHISTAEDVFCVKFTLHTTIVSAALRTYH